MSEETESRGDNTSAGITVVDTTAISESLNRLCNHSMTNISVPRFDSYTDAYDFISQFERITSMLSDNQRLLVLPKAFPVDCHRSWYSTELAPLIKGKSTWHEVKTKIIERFSATGQEDKHFSRLKELKFDPESDQSLLNYIEDILYSYKRTYPQESDENALKYIKLSLPPSLRAKLNLYADFKNAQDIHTLKEAVRDYDLAKGTSPKKSKRQVATEELTNIVKELVANVQKETQSLRNENQAILKEVTAALSSQADRKPPPRQQYERSYSPIRDSSYYRQKSPDRSRYRSPQRQEHFYQERGGYNREGSPYRERSPHQGRQFYRESRPQAIQMANEDQGNFSGRRTPSPANYRARYPTNVYNRPPTPNYNDIQRNLSVNDEPFDVKAYYAKFGKPPSPCSNCGHMHWTRHCIDHLN